MVARWYHADVNGDFTEITDRIGRVDWEVREEAEEGQAALSSIVFDDPAMDWDPEPWRNWYVLEDTSEDANSMLCGGWTAEQEIGREGGEWTQPLGRVTSVGHTDENASWQMRVMVGADANRPAETDVERFQWLMTTNEMAWALDVTTYVQTTTPIDMDACDYRGQMLAQIADDCAQASGRNWYAWIDMIAAVRTVTVWYGHDDWAVRDSLLSLSNDQADWDDDELEDGTSLVWPISMDTKLARDPSRMYDGVLVQYDGGSVYRDTDPRTVRRDFIAPSANVKSKAKAEARALRYLADLDEQDLVLRTSVELPAAKCTMIRAGMRLQFRATHLPGFDAFRWCRVLTCSVKPVAAGDRYQLTLELVPVGVVVPAVRWLYYEHYGGAIDPELTIDVSDDGDAWTTLFGKTELEAGTTDPPNATPGTYAGLVAIPEDDYMHRYWRIAYSKVHAGGYFGGTTPKILRLLSEGSSAAVCRLGTTNAGGIFSWWVQLSGACSTVGTDPCWTGDIPYTAVSNIALLFGGTSGGATCATGQNATSLVAGQGCGYGMGATVPPAGTYTASWTFDLLEGA